MSIETVQGGGMVIFLLNQIQNLEQLSQSQMRAHKRYQTLSKLSAACVPRFNERFCKILQNCPRAIALDEDLNVVDISPLSKKIMELKENEKSDDGRLRDLQAELSKCEDPVKSALTKKAVTFDQCSLLAKIMDLFNGVELTD